MSGGRQPQASQDRNGLLRGRPDGSPPAGRPREQAAGPLKATGSLRDTSDKCQRSQSWPVSDITRTSVSAS